MSSMFTVTGKQTNTNFTQDLKTYNYFTSDSKHKGVVEIASCFLPFWDIFKILTDLLLHLSLPMHVLPTVISL